MLKLYCLNISQFKDKAKFEAGKELADEERRGRLDSLVAQEKILQCVAAGAILPLALKDCGITESPRILRGEWGKPQLIKPVGLHYSLSHSGGYVFLALSDSPVGCDAELIREVDLRVAGRFFCPVEVADIMAAKDKTARFFAYWTAKESYLKALGCGLSRQLNSFVVSFVGDTATVSDPFEKVGRTVVRYGRLKGYELCVCTPKACSLPTVKELYI